MRKWNLPLTYKPKTQPVINGTCKQTIRIGNKKKIGDLVRFYRWIGKPYHSKRETITEYKPLTNVVPCRIRNEGIDDLKFQGEFGLWDWNELDTLAELDGIVPATGIESGNILMSKNKIPQEGIEAQILRW